MNKLDWKINDLARNIKEWSSRPKQDSIDKMIIAQDQWLLDVLTEYKELKERNDAPLPIGNKACVVCNQLYISSNSRSQFCSDKCRVANHRKSKLANEQQKGENN